MVGPADIPTVEGIEGLTVIGRGGFATVYRGRQPAFHRDVAVKVLQRSELDTDDRRRFERECQAMGALSNHPGIVTLYDAGFTADERPYLVMSYVPDGSLQDRLAQGPIPWRDVTVIGVRLAGALETAHRALVVHRDVKPANVLRSAYGEQLTDFGIARLQGGHETLTGVITASVAHAAPEILDGQPPDARADIYSLGSTLYASLAGSAAYVRSTDEGLLALIHRVGSAPLPDLREKGIPDALASVVETSMAKDPAQRFASAEDLGHAICDAQSELGLPETALMIVGGSRDRTQPTAHPTRVITPLDGDTAQPPSPPDPPTTQLPRERSSGNVPPPHVPSPPVEPAADDERSPARWVLPLALGGVALVAVAGFVLWPGGDDTADPPNTAVSLVPDETAAPETDATAIPDSTVADSVSVDTTVPRTADDTVETTAVEVLPVPTETGVVATTQTPPDADVGGTLFVGIDGIAYDPFRQQLLAAREPAPPDISAGNASLATPTAFSIPIQLPDGDTNGELALDLEAASAVTLLRDDGTAYGLELDVEGMAVLPDGSYYVVSEGNDPAGGDAGFFAHRLGADGRFISELALPDWYRTNPEGTRGFTTGRGLHGIDVRPDAPDEVIVIVEAPLIQDHDPSVETEPKFARIIAFDVETGEPTREWAYPLDLLTAAEAETTEAGNLVVDMAALSDGSLAVLESTATTDGRELVLYRVDLGDGGVPSEDAPPLATKTSIPLNTDDGAIELDNFRSVTAGPEWTDGRSTLLLASDNEFGSEPTEFTMIAVAAPN